MDDLEDELAGPQVLSGRDGRARSASRIGAAGTSSSGTSMATTMCMTMCVENSTRP